jgi:hypothetical protein
MLELALTLTLLGGAPESPASHLRLVPPLTLSQPAGAPAPAPDLALPPPAPARRGSQALQVLLASGGMFLGDSIAATFFMLGVISLMGEMFEGDTSSRTDTIFLLGVGTWLFLPPALGIAGAKAGGAPPGRGWRAYGLTFVLRLAVAAAFVGLAERDQERFAVPVVAATELVVSPLVIVRVLGGAEPRPVPGPGPALPSPTALALPAR